MRICLSEERVRCRAVSGACVRLNTIAKRDNHPHVAKQSTADPHLHTLTSIEIKIHRALWRRLARWPRRRFLLLLLRIR